MKTYQGRSRPCAHAAEGRGAACRRFRWLTGLWLLVSLPGGPALPAQPACGAAAALLVHPQVRGVYVEAVKQLVMGLERGGVDDLAVCPLTDFKSAGISPSGRIVFSVGDAVTREVVRAGDGFSVLGLLISRPHRSMQWGVSRFVDANPVITRVLSLKPGTRRIHLVHLKTTPAGTRDRVKAAARRAGLEWQATEVSSIGEAARVIETLKVSGDRHTVVWFHNGVLGLNPDVLIPPLVRISWERGLFVLADDAAYVERGILMSVTPDLEALGALAAQAATARWTGLRDVLAIHWGVNLRTASALGIEGRLRKGAAPDFIYE